MVASAQRPARRRWHCGQRSPYPPASRLSGQLALARVPQLAPAALSPLIATITPRNLWLRLSVRLLNLWNVLKPVAPAVAEHLALSSVPGQVQAVPRRPVTEGGNLDLELPGPAVMLDGLAVSLRNSESLWLRSLAASSMPGWIIRRKELRSCRLA